jgi:6-pyruvoyl-tetrahydropterin synthase related domain
MAATAIVSPMIFLGNSSGHDFRFHLESWMDVAQQWHQGILLPRWAEWANWGFGEPRFIFYPPLSWLLGAAIGSILPWRMAPGTFIWLALVLAGMSMWWLAREHLSQPYAIAAAILYAVNPYQLVIIYYRSAFGELLAAAFLPLTIWGAVRLIARKPAAIPIFSVSFAAIWLSNAPAAVITSYAVAIVFVVGCAQRRHFQPLLLGAVGMAGGVSLAAFYILPAAWEQRWVQIKQAVLENLQPSSNFLFTRTTDPDFTAFNWKISWVATGIIVATLFGILLTLKKRAEHSVWWILAALATISIFLMLRPSLFVWRAAPKLWFIQFPWRWLDILGLAFAFFVALALSALPPRLQKLGLGTVLVTVAVAGIALARNAYWDSSDIADIAASIQTDHGYEGTDEYTPVGCDRYQFPGDPDDSERPDDVSAVPAPRIAMLGSAENAPVPIAGTAPRIEFWSSERKGLTVDTNRAMTLAPRLVGYPAWEAQINGGSVNPELRSGTQQILLPIPPGSNHIEIRFRRTWDRTLGGAISIFTAALMGAFVWVKRKQIREIASQ